ncbi:MAG: DUF4192 domain-containing protein [Actinomycetes bacterium]
MTDSPAPTRVRLSSPGDVLAAVPHLLGFHPADSLVVVSLRGRTGRVGLCARMDLPPSTATVEAGERMAAYLRRDAARAALLVTYLSSPGDLRADVPLACAGALERAGITVRDALRVADGRWWSYLCTGPCCPAEGTPVPDADASPVAAASVLAGQVVWPDRARAAAVLDPPPEPDAHRVRELLAVGGSPRDTGAGPATRHTVASLRRIAELTERLADPRATLTDAEVVAVVVALDDRAARDEVALWAAGTRGERVQRLLVDVARRVPPPRDAEVAAALACVAYQRGEGMLARAAIDRALAGRPGHRLAAMLEAALDAGIPPAALTEARTRARASVRRGGA